MSRYERTQYFEALVALRLTYEARSDYDRMSVISIEDAIAYSEAVMAALEIEDRTAVVDEVTLWCVVMRASSLPLCALRPCLC